MNLISFIQTYRDPSFQDQRIPVICFQVGKEKKQERDGDEYPVLFFSRLCSQVPGLVRLSTDVESKELIAQLEMSFLGQYHRYWLTNVHLLDQKKMSLLLAYLAGYKGPHTILFFLPASIPFSSASGVVIPVEQTVTKEMMGVLAAVMPMKQHSWWMNFLTHIQESYGPIPLDQALLLMQYATVINPQDSSFRTHWLPKIITSELSLFSLSQYFFARQAKKFYTLWRQVSLVYPPAFWTTYWSEQLWRAYFFITLRSSSPADAKKVAFRLPFSFIQRDWQQVTAHELATAHQYMYEIDHAVKNSRGDGALDLFYGKFFARTFTK